MRPTASRMLTTALLLFCAAVSWADTLFLLNGDQHEGRLKKMTASKVEFQTSTGTLSFHKDAVLRLQLQRERLFDEIDAADQIADPDLTAALAVQAQAETYTTAAYARLFERRTYDLRVPGKLTKTVRVITKILKQRGEDAASTNVYYFDDTDKARIDFALTVTPEGRVLHLSDAALKQESVYAGLPAYKRLSRLRFACKEPRPGSVLDVQYTLERDLEPTVQPFYDQVLFESDEPILRKEVVILAPNDPQPRVLAAIKQAEGPLIMQSQSVEDGGLRTVYTLEAPKSGTIAEPFMPPPSTFASTLVLGEAATWEALREDYASRLASLPALPQEMAAKARELAAQGGSLAIQEYVTRNVATVGVPQTSYRIVPHAPGEVVALGLGNELDKNYLCYALLKAADIPAAFALVRSRHQGPLTEGVPSLMAFDASAVYLPEEKRYLSTSSDVLDLQVLPAGLQGAPALTVLGDATPGMAQTAPGIPEAEESRTVFEGELDQDGNLKLEVTFTGTGNAVTWMRSLKDLDEQRLRKACEQMAAGLHPEAVLEHHSTSDLADLRTAPQIALSVSVPAYAFKAGEELMLMTLPTVDYSASSVGRPMREHDLFWDSVQRVVTEGSLRIPKGYRAYYLPPDSDCDGGVASYESDLNMRRGVLRFKDEYLIKQTEAPAAAYEGFKRCVETRADLARQRIILKRGFL